MRTRTAVGDLGGVTYVFFNLEGERGLYPGETEHEEHPYIQFANAGTFPELMAALDRLYDKDDVPCLYPYLGTTSKPEKTTNAKKVASVFEEAPSRRMIDRVKAAIEIWSFENSKPDAESQDEIDSVVRQIAERNKYVEDDSELYSEDPKDHHWKPFLPLADIARARYDLYLTSRLLAWLVDKIPFELAHSQGEPVGKGVRMEDRPHLDLIDIREETTIGEYYRELAKREQNKGASYFLVGKHLPMARMNDYREINMRQDAGQYVSLAYSMLLSDTHDKMTSYYGSKPELSNYHATLLSSMWSYMANAICKEPGAGSVTVCLHCGKLIQQERASRKFCSKSCSHLHKAAERAAAIATPVQ
jgi:hypothetical protein